MIDKAIVACREGLQQMRVVADDAGIAAFFQRSPLRSLTAVWIECQRDRFNDRNFKQRIENSLAINTGVPLFSIIFVGEQLKMR